MKLIYFADPLWEEPTGHKSSNKQRMCRWFEAPWRPCDIIVMGPRVKKMIDVK